MSKNTTRIIASMLLLLFLSFQSGRMFCYHTHIFGDRIISHSHPFNNPDYHHTVTEIEALEIISTSALTDCISEVPELVSPDTYIIIVPATIVAGLVDSTERTTAERAPPVA